VPVSKALAAISLVTSTSVWNCCHSELSLCAVAEELEVDPVPCGVGGLRVGVDSAGRPYGSAGIPGTGLSVHKYGRRQVNQGAATAFVLGAAFRGRGSHGPGGHSDSTEQVNFRNPATYRAHSGFIC
jgi:hypothetical protein